VTEPAGKDERQRRNFARALSRFSALFYRSMRRHEQVLEQHTVQIQSLQDAIEDLRDQVTDARNQALAARALYYDTHDTVTGEHVDRDVHHVGGGVFDESTAEYVDPRELPDARTQEKK
jgi:hypothetical protein